MRTTPRRTVALAAIAVVTALVVPGAQGVTASANGADYRLSTQRLPDGRTVVARWNPCQVITVRVNDRWAAGTSSQRSAAIKDVRTAIAKLSAATGIPVRYAGTTSQIPTNTSSSSWWNRQGSAEIVVAWVNQSKSYARTNLLNRVGRGYAAGTGGYAYKFWRVGNAPWSGATGRGFVVIDASQNGKFRAGFGRGETRGALLMHELGHSVGLMHVGSTSELMYPTMLYRSGAGYNAGDRVGLARLGVRSGCIAVPGWVWPDQS